MESVQGVIVGDSGAGKTSLVQSFFNNEFPQTPKPAQIHSATRMVDGNLINLEISDTESPDHFKLAASGAYPVPNVILVCFPLVDPAALENAREKWVAEARQHYPKVPLILVGTKLDLREMAQAEAEDLLIPVTEAQGMTLAKEVKAAGYIECSSLTQKNVPLVFDQAVRVVLSLNSSVGGKPRRGSKCRTQ